MAKKLTLEKLKPSAWESETVEFKRKTAVDAMQKNEEGARSFVRNCENIGDAPEKPAMVQGAIYDVTERGQIEGAQKKDGTSFIGSVSAVVVKDEKDEIKYYDGIIEDITERMRAEAALRESEERYRTVLEANPDPVVLYDNKGQVIYFNPAFTSVFGWTIEERSGKKMDVFVPEKARQETKIMIEKVVAGERFSGIETCRYNKKGNIIPAIERGNFSKGGSDAYETIYYLYFDSRLLGRNRLRQAIQMGR